MAFPINILLAVAAAVVGVWVLIKALVGLGWVLGQVFRFLGSFFGRIGAFIGGMVTDTLRIVGGALTGAFFVPFILTNIALGRWSRANHYGKALEREAVGVGSAAYRVAIGHVGRLLGLTSLTDGIERRIPEAMARAPGPDTPRGRPDSFEGYTVVGSLPAGGSGAKLFLAEPLPEKRAHLSAAGLPVPRRVVIKSFSLADGSTMPQIVRESRALEAARKLGLVLEHDLGGTRFHYVMPYVPGEDLSIVSQRLHDESGSEGLGQRQLEQAMSYTSDLLQILQRFHTSGLWHKDIKPSNIIVSEGRVHLVDLGLITPLRSAMTLTTHGTEYFRDPELVRLALRGVKVHEVDGVKFDIYGAGAVLFSVIENSFPAHGSLSQIRRRCPESLRWIVRRAMADMGKRYASAAEMLADLRTVMTARDPHAVKPASLPSVSGNPALVQTIISETSAQPAHAVFAAGPSVVDDDLARAPDRGRVAATTRSGGMRWGSIAALLLVGLFGVVVFGSLMMGVRMDHSDNSAFTLDESSAHAPVPAPERLRLAGASGGSGQSVPDHTSLAARRTASPSIVLVLDDLGATLSEPHRAQLDIAYDHFEQAGFTLIGVGRDTPALGEAQVTELEADVRHLVGQTVFWDADLRTQLETFLKDSSAGLQAVLRLDRGDQADTIRTQLVARNDQDAEDLRTILGEISVAESNTPAHAGTDNGFRYDIY